MKSSCVAPLPYSSITKKKTRKWQAMYSTRKRGKAREDACYVNWKYYKTPIIIIFGLEPS